jgi:hypothetical protein
VQVQFNRSICRVMDSTPTSITCITSGLQGGLVAGTPYPLALAPSQVCAHHLAHNNAISTPRLNADMSKLLFCVAAAGCCPADLPRHKLHIRCHPHPPSDLSQPCQGFN